LLSAKLSGFDFSLFTFFVKEENTRLQYALCARKIQQQRIWRAAFAWQRRAGWVYPRLQGWFEEMCQNQAMSSSLFNGDILLHLSDAWARPDNSKHSLEKSDSTD